MKTALILFSENSRASPPVAPLRLLGYIPVVAKTMSAATILVNTIKFNVVVIDKPTLAGDRRSLAGEIRRALPMTLVILVTDSDDIYSRARFCHYSGITAVMREPLTYQKIWRIIEFEKEGFGCHPGWLDPNHERRLTTSLPIINAM